MVRKTRGGANYANKYGILYIHMAVMRNAKLNKIW
jgi:hypothetical protein